MYVHICLLVWWKSRLWEIIYLIWFSFIYTPFKIKYNKGVIQIQIKKNVECSESRYAWKNARHSIQVISTLLLCFLTKLFIS